MFDNIFEETSLIIIRRTILSTIDKLGYVMVSGNLSDLDADELYEVHDLFREGDNDEAILYLEDRGIRIEGGRND